MNNRRKGFKNGAILLCLVFTLLFPVAAQVYGDSVDSGRKWSRIIENKTFTRTLRLEGASWSNTLVRGVRVEGADKMGIFLSGVRNVRIENSVVTDIRGNCIQLSSRGSTHGVEIVGNHLENCRKNGIAVAQRSGRGVDHTGLRIIGNSITNTGLKRSGKGLHGIYVQGSDFEITGNIVTGARWGHGISVRSSGTIRNNLVADVEGVDNGKRGSGIAYYSDHKTGRSKTLRIENNLVFLDTLRARQGAAISLLKFARKTSEHFRVRRVFIRDNSIVSEGGREPIGIHKDWARPGYQVSAQHNRVKNKLPETDYSRLRDQLMQADGR